MNSARVILESLKREGVDVVFGYPGGSVIPLYDALYDFDLDHILTRHEQGAAHAADGYARASGKVGVCIATSGPGATNLTTGIANAYLDSVPMVAITGQVRTQPHRHRRLPGGRRHRHHAAHRQAQLPGEASGRPPAVIHEAFYIARTGRPGPVVMDIPVDLTTMDFDYDPEGVQKIDLPGYKPTVKGHPKQIKAAAQAIAEAQRPVIFAGGGVISANAADELREFALYAKIPVTTSLTGIGCFPEDNEELSLGMLGMHGTRYANYAISQLRPHLRRRRPLRRPRHRQDLHVRPRGQDHPRGRGPGRDLQERGRGRPHRG